jgi:hypothetical protein
MFGPQVVVEKHGNPIDISVFSDVPLNGFDV